MISSKAIMLESVEPPWPLAFTSSQGLLVQVGASYPAQWTGQSQLPREMLTALGMICLTNRAAPNLV